jgi:hypothetical protein
MQLKPIRIQYLFRGMSEGPLKAKVTTQIVIAGLATVLWGVGWILAQSQRKVALQPPRESAPGADTKDSDQMLWRIWCHLDGVRSVVSVERHDLYKLPESESDVS